MFSKKILVAISLSALLGISFFGLNNLLSANENVVDTITVNDLPTTSLDEKNENGNNDYSNDKDNNKTYQKISTTADFVKIYNDFEMEISYINNLKSGRIIIGITDFLGTHILPTIIPYFKEICPNINIYVHEKNSTELESSLISGEIDFAIMHMPPQKREPSLEFDPINIDPFLLATKKNHPLSIHAKSIDSLSYPSIDLKLFKDEPFIVLNSNKRIGQISNAIFEKADITPQIILTLNNFETARRLTSTGLGVTFVPYEYSKVFANQYEASYFNIDQKYNAYWTTCIATNKNMYISKASRVFMDLVKKEYALKELYLTNK